MHVVVVGGGVVGLATAQALAERGVEVTVVERGTVGGENSVRTGGGIREQFGTEVSIRLSRESLRTWEQFEERFGVDIDFRRIGYLFLAQTERTAARLEENVELQQRLGVESEFLDPDEATVHCPGLQTERYVGATFCPTDGYANHHRIVQGYLEAVIEAGSQVLTGTAVTDLTLEDGAVVGVETDQGEIAADYVVNAAGAWAGNVAAMAGVDLPLTAVRRQLLIAEPETVPPTSLAWTADLDDGVHFRPHGSHRCLVGGYLRKHDPVVDPDRISIRHDAAWESEVLAHAEEVSPVVGPSSTVKRGWAGVYAMTPDSHPVIEESISGLVTAAGFSGHGLMQSPATGQVVSEIILDGGADLVDVDPLSRDRFTADGSSLAEDTVF